MGATVETPETRIRLCRHPLSDSQAVAFPGDAVQRNPGIWVLGYRKFPRTNSSWFRGTKNRRPETPAEGIRACGEVEALFRLR